MLTSEWLRYVASSFDRQLHLHDLVSTLDWQFDVAAGVLSFADQYSWQVQLLGTESESAGTWLWAWANTASRIPEHLLDAGRTMKTLGEQHDIPEITQPEVPLAHIDGHTISLLASSICQANAYYRCPFDGGSLFVLINDETFPKCSNPPLARITSVFFHVVASLDIPDHRLAFTNYLDDYGLKFEQEGSRIVAKDANELMLVATFDE